jgi:ferredoxin
MKADRTFCLYCGACAGSCPENAVFLDERFVTFDDKTCVKCKLCEKVCPLGAISGD